MLHILAGNRALRFDGKVSYPPLKKRQEASEPIRSAESRRLLEAYQQAAAEAGRERAKRRIFQNPGSTARRASGAKRAEAAHVEELMAEAQTAEEANKFEDAQILLSEAIRKVNPQTQRELHAELHTRMGLLLMACGSFDEALESLTLSVHSNPLRSENYLHRANAHTALQQTDLAFFEFEKYFKLEQPPKGLLVRCGKCALDTERLKDAERYFNEALSRGSGEEDDTANDAYAYYNLGELEEKRGNTAAAQELFAKVLAVDPHFPEPYLEQAESEFHNKNFPVALNLYEALVKMTPNNDYCCLRLADVYDNLGLEFATSSMNCLSRALELQEGKVREETLVRRGTLYFRLLRDFDKAIGDFSACLLENPSNCDALSNRAEVYLARQYEGDKEASTADHRSLVSIPAVPWTMKAVAYRHLAHYYAQENDHTQAAKCFAYAAANGVISEEDHKVFIREVVQCVTVNDFVSDETYDARGWASPKGKGEISLLKGQAVLPLLYDLPNKRYTAIRELEPTMHAEDEYALIALWKPIRDEVDRRREEADSLRLGKKPKKGGK